MRGLSFSERQGRTYMVEIMHVVYGGTGGAARVVTEIVKRHNRNRYNPAVVLVGYEVDPQYAQELAEDGIPAFTLRKQKKWDLRFFRSLRRLIAERRPEIVVLHTPVAYFWGRTALLGLGVKLVVSVEHLAVENYYGSSGRVINMAQAHLLTDRVVCVSESVRSVVQRELRLPDWKVRVIENGLPVECYPRTDQAALLSGKPVRLKMVSRLDSQKDPATLIKAAGILLEEGIDFRLDFVGDGMLRREMELLAQQLGLNRRVAFLGTRRDVPELLLDTDIFVLATHAEGLPIALIEAMAVGLPCIATAVPGTLDVVQDHVTGLLVAESDPAALSEAVRFLINNPEEARRMAAAARDKVTQQYNISRTAKEYENLFAEALTLRIRMPEHEKRTFAQLKEHYEIEKELADRLRRASKKERGCLYSALYDELYRRVPHHPQITRKANPEAQKNAVSRQVKFLERFIKADSTFLEVGPGDCTLALAVAKIARKVYAVDVSEEITRGVALPQNCDLIISSGSSIPLPGNSVDVAYSNQLMEHLHPKDAAEQLQEIHNVLTRGGVYICITPNRLFGPHDISMYFDETATGFHLKEYTTRELADLFKKAGFSKIRCGIGFRGFRVLGPALPICWAEGVISNMSRLLGTTPNRLPVKILPGSICIIAWK